MKLIRERQFKKFLRLLRERNAVNGGKDGIHNVVGKILNDVRKDGDKAVKKYTERFDSIKLKKLSISSREINASAVKADKKFLKALELSARRIKAFHELQKEKSWYFVCT